MIKPHLVIPGFLISSSFILTACGGGGSGDSSPATDSDTMLQNTKGTLSIQLNGLPPSVEAALQLTGPNNYAQNVSSSTQLRDLPHGQYTLKASTQEVNKALYQPSIREQVITVSNSAATATVLYQAPKVIEGVITGFGSVYINGERFELSSAQQAELQLGMNVLLEAKSGFAGTFTEIEAVSYDATVKGAISDIQYAQNKLTVLGQTFSIDARTKLNSDSLTSFKLGDFVEVSAILTNHNAQVATFIDKISAESDYELEGQIVSVDKAQRQFTIGSQRIDYSLLTDLIESIQVGNYVEVKSSQGVQNSILIAESVELEEEQHPVGAYLLQEGVISSVSEHGFTMSGQSYVIVDDTDFEQGELSELSIGVRVFVKATLGEEGHAYVDLVRFDKKTDIELTGAIEAINLETQSITVLGTDFTTDAYTQFEDDSEQAEYGFNLASLSQGDVVDIDAFSVNGKNVIRDLEREATSQQSIDDERTLKGSVTSIAADSNTIVMSGVTLQLNAATDIEANTSIGLEAFFNTVKLGDLLDVEYINTEAGLIATEVEFEESKDESRLFELSGKVEQLDLSAGSFHLNGFALSFDLNTEFESGSVSLLSNDKIVEVEVLQRANGEMLITEIEFAENEMDVELEGKIDALVSESELIVQGVTVVISAETSFEEGQASDLAVGETIEVEGAYAGSGKLIAQSIEFEDKSAEEIILNGVVSSAITLDANNTSVFSLKLDDGTAVTITLQAQTDFENGQRDKLNIGETIKVEAKRLNGVIFADEIQFNAVEYKIVKGGITEFVSDDLFYVLGHKVTVTEQTKLDLNEGTLALDSYVELEGQVLSSSSTDSLIRADKVVVKEPQISKLEGIVVDLSTQHFFVDGVEVILSENTNIDLNDANTLQSGHYVEVEGMIIDGKLHADKVILKEK